MLYSELHDTMINYSYGKSFTYNGIYFDYDEYYHFVYGDISYLVMNIGMVINDDFLIQLNKDLIVSIRKRKIYELLKKEL